MDPIVSALVERIRACLTDDLLTPDQRRRERRTPSAGHCYVASEALWHLTGRTLSAFQMRHEGNSHWFLFDFDNDEVIDPTADQFATLPPYGEARHMSFLTKEPSKRARVLIARVRDEARATL